MARYGYAGMFWKSIPKRDWPDDKESLEAIEAHWEEPFGDMRQELVFIGQSLDEHAMVTALDNSLLSDNDLLEGKQHWKTLADPFPAWMENT